MKRTLVERVSMAIIDGMVFCWPTGKIERKYARREARRIIAMVRRHDRKEKGKV